jgi:hypothetical protein
MHRILLAFAIILPLCAQVKITQQSPAKVSIEIDGKPFSDFYIGPENAKPYLHPLRSASGLLVTRQYPMAEIAGESRDHPHHRGLWFTHGDVNGYDFWGNEDSQAGAGKGKGKVVLVKINKISNGHRSGYIDSTFEWQIPGGHTIMTETRRMTFYSDPVLRMLDFDSTLAPEEDVTFGDTKEGMFAIRVADAMDEEHGGKLVNAQNKSGEKNVWGKRSEWCDYSGKINGQEVGIAILDNPANPRQPAYWHARAYGLFAEQIFGWHDFENDKSRDGSLTIRHGQPVRFRYRVVIHPGDVYSGHVREMYEAYKAIKEK